MSKLLTLGKSFLFCTVTCAKHVYCKNFIFILASFIAAVIKPLSERKLEIFGQVSQDEDTGGLFALFLSCTQQWSRILFDIFFCRSPLLVFHISWRCLWLFCSFSKLLPPLDLRRLHHLLKTIMICGLWLVSSINKILVIVIDKW